MTTKVLLPPKEPVKALGRKLDEMRERGVYQAARSICAREGALVEHLFGSSRSLPQVRSRHLFWWELKDRGWTYKEIAELCERDWQTIRYGVRRACRDLGMPRGAAKEAA
ncbi:hypothetical protein [Sorangium sp. So ce233]|uniref:hypothetical protein n=1 Tax=Sorangium sp. So ce233 TaxID=3133290 RepID=UPI003F5E5934